MSIINQTLKELDKRQQGNASGRARYRYQPGRARRATAWWMALGVVGGLLAGYVLFSLLQSEDNRGDLQVQRVVPVVTEPQTQAPAPVVPVLIPARELPAEHTSAEQTAEAAASVQTPPSNADAASTQGMQSSRAQHDNPQQLADYNAAAAEPAGDSDAAPDNGSQMRVERVERSASELSERKYNQGVEYIEQGQGRRGEQLLNEALLLEPGHTGARQQLAAYYYGRGFTSQAIQTLREGLSYNPGNIRLVLLSARIYEEAGRTLDALNVLSEVSASLPEHADILVLRAALASEVGNDELAARTYRQLTDWRPGRGIWWLGLAIAEDNLDNADAARDAYQQALQDPQLDDGSRDFAASRVEVLR